MRVLFVTYDFPFPTTSGGKNRAFNLLKQAAKTEEIYLFSFVRDDFHPDYATTLKEIGIKNITIFKRKKLSNYLNIPRTILSNSSIFKTLYFEEDVVEMLKKIIADEKIDLIHCESSYTGFYINSDLKRLHVKKVLGTENIEYMLYKDYARSQNLIKKSIVNQQANKLKNEELLMVKNADVTTTITSHEAQILENLTGKKCFIVANGINTKELSYKFNKDLKNNILFVGNFSYFPNVEAVNFFVQEVFNKIDSKITLTIVGKKANKTFDFKNKRILIKDFVEEIIDEYRNADILVFPIKIGGGTNFKVLEAMSLGIPVVAYPDRLSGLKAVAGEHFLEAREGNDFVDKINNLYKYFSLREKISKNARQLVEKNYDWENIGKDLIKVWKNIV